MTLTSTISKRILSPVENPAAYRPYCETWADHDWSARRMVDSGRDRSGRAFQTYHMTCSRCPKIMAQTEWTDLKAAGLGGAQP